MIVQGTNTPISLTFDEDIETGATKLEAGLFKDGKELKHWSRDDMLVAECIVTLPLTEAETMDFPAGTAILEVKWLENNLTYFAQRMQVPIEERKDKTKMTEDVRI